MQIKQPKFEQRFKGNLKEVFAYITSRCNLRCAHCYMGDAKNENMDIAVFRQLIKKLVDLGATKITLLGGEPTLHPLFLRFIKDTKALGVDYVRLDTNGEFDSDLLENQNFKKLDDICFSLDGVNPEIHAKIRTEKNYHSVINNIKKAVSLGYNVRVTMTINSFNLQQIKKMAQKLDKMGVSALNIHLTSENGRAKINSRLLVDENKWMDFYEKILPKLAKYNIKIKIPKRYIKQGEHLEGKITCESAKSTRLLVTSDFNLYSCPLLLDTNRYFAYFRNGKISYAKNYKNNIFQYPDVVDCSCPLLMKNNYTGYRSKKIVPICISYKQTNK